MNQKPFFYASELKWRFELQKLVEMAKWVGENRRVCWGAEVEEVVKNGVRRKGKKGMLVMDNGDYYGGTLWFLTLLLSFDDKGASHSWVGEEEDSRSWVGGAFHFCSKV